VFLISGQAFALPELESIVSGTAKINKINDTSMQIDTSDKAVLNFKQFNIGENESVMFKLPGTSGKVLNRVTGGDFSSILGSLKSNGTVFLINEKGILFGPNSSVDVGGLIASTRNISDQDFRNGNYNFSRSSEGEDRLLLNEGKININNGGFAVLIAGAVENKGAILGNVAMAAGDSIRVSFPSKGNVSVVIDKETAQNVFDYNGKPVTDQIKNTGAITANGGLVLLKAEAVQDILTKAINLDGIVKADKAKGKAGNVQLVSNDNIDVSGKIEATNIALNSDKALTSTGTLDAADTLRLRAKGAISSSGTLKAGFLDEYGATLRLSGNVDVGDSLISNADNAVYFGTGNYSGTYSDIDKIIINKDAVITLKGATTFQADSDRNGSGYFNMWSGSKIIGNGYDLTLYASTGSRLRDISGVRYLTLNAAKSGSQPTYGAKNEINLTGRVKAYYTTLDMDHNDLVTPSRIMGDGWIARNMNFYVDATLGDDNKGGTSVEYPWKSLDRINGAYAAFQPGDIVHFKRGEVWRGVLGVKSGDATGDITYTAYGTGAKPMILGSLSFSNPNGWTNYGGNVWKKSGTYALDIGNLIFNDEASVGVKKWSRADLKAQGDFYYDRGTDSFYMYSASNPGNYYNNIEAALRQNCINISNDHHVTIENFDLRYAGSHGINGENASFITIQDNDISFIGGGDQYNDGKMRYGNGIEFFNSAHDTIVRRNRISNIFDAGITTQGTANGNVKYNQYFYNNVVEKAEYGWEYFNITPNGNSNTYNIYVDNNTFLDSGKGWGHNQRTSVKKGTAILMSLDNGTLSDFYIRNNIAKEATEHLVYINHTSDLPAINLDNNLYYTSTGNLAKVENRGQYFSPSQLSNWQSAYGKDANSQYAEPRLWYRPEFAYRLSGSSPAINKGLNLSYIEDDFEGRARPRGTGYDIGAYEY
jgi:filamentous hemagglutinin family protein